MINCLHLCIPNLEVVYFNFLGEIQSYSLSFPGDPLVKIIAHPCSKVKALPPPSIPPNCLSHTHTHPHTFWLPCIVPWKVASSPRTVQLWGCLPHCGLRSFWYTRNWCAVWSSSHSNLAQQCSVAWCEAQLPQRLPWQSPAASTWPSSMAQSLRYPTLQGPCWPAIYHPRWPSPYSYSCCWPFTRQLLVIEGLFSQVLWGNCRAVTHELPITVSTKNTKPQWFYFFNCEAK